MYRIVSIPSELNRGRREIFALDLVRGFVLLSGELCNKKSLSFRAGTCSSC